MSDLGREAFLQFLKQHEEAPASQNGQTNQNGEAVAA
jgi:hypothetical protein